MHVLAYLFSCRGKVVVIGMKSGHRPEDAAVLQVRVLPVFRSSGEASHGEV